MITSAELKKVHNYVTISFPKIDSAELKSIANLEIAKNINSVPKDVDQVAFFCFISYRRCCDYIDSLMAQKREAQEIELSAFIPVPVHASVDFSVWYDGLTDLERTTIDDTLNGYKQYEIANKMGVTGPYICQVRHRAIAKMQRNAKKVLTVKQFQKMSVDKLERLINSGNFRIVWK